MNEKRFDRLDERLDSIEKTLLRNTITLEEHVKRAAALDVRMQPLEDHVKFAKFLVKIGGAGLTLLLALGKITGFI